MVITYPAMDEFVTNPVGDGFAAVIVDYGEEWALVKAHELPIYNLLTSGRCKVPACRAERVIALLNELQELVPRTPWFAELACGEPLHRSPFFEPDEEITISGSVTYYVYYRGDHSALRQLPGRLALPEATEYLSRWYLAPLFLRGQMYMTDREFYRYRDVVEELFNLTSPYRGSHKLVMFREYQRPQSRKSK